MDVILRRTHPIIAACIACLLVVACSQQELLETITSAEDRALSLEIIKAVQAGDSAKIGEIAKPDIAKELAPVVSQMRKLLPPAASSEPRLVDAKTGIISSASGGTTRHSYLAYALDEGKQHAVVRLAFERAGGEVWMTGLHVSPLPKPVEELTAFSLSGKSFGHYFMLALAALSMAVIVTSLVVLYRARIVRRKWLWAIGCVLGIGKFAMNWSTGAVSFSPLAVQVLGVGVVKAGGLMPWEISVGIPVVAYIFLLSQVRARAVAGEGAAQP